MDPLHMYFMARRTCLEMLVDRKYTVPPHLFNLTEKEFISMRLLTINDDIIDNNGNKVHVVMCLEDTRFSLFERIGKLFDVKRNEDDVVEYVKKNNIHLIIIYNDRSGSPFKLYEDFVGDQNIEVFDVNYMKINPTKGKYQPQWRLMSDEEVTKILQKLEAGSSKPTRSLLGGVCIDDPMNRYYWGRPMSKDYKGDVYEIIDGGTRVFYRRVISKGMNLKGIK